MQLIKNKKIIILILFFVISFTAYYILQSRNERTAPGATNTALNEPVFNKVPEEEEVELNGVVMNNFIKDNPHSPQLNIVQVVQSNDYEIQYMNSYNYFLITVTNTPFFQKRILAENELLRQLNISREDACKLNVKITTPRQINPDEAGQEFNLSFCSQYN